MWAGTIKHHLAECPTHIRFIKLPVVTWGLYLPHHSSSLREMMSLLQRTKTKLCVNWKSPPDRELTAWCLGVSSVKAGWEMLPLTQNQGENYHWRLTRPDIGINHDSCITNITASIVYMTSEKCNHPLLSSSFVTLSPIRTLRYRNRVLFLFFGPQLNWRPVNHLLIVLNVNALNSLWKELCPITTNILSSIWCQTVKQSSPSLLCSHFTNNFNYRRWKRADDGCFGGVTACSFSCVHLLW